MSELDGIARQVGKYLANQAWVPNEISWYVCRVADDKLEVLLLRPDGHNVLYLLDHRLQIEGNRYLPSTGGRNGRSNLRPTGYQHR